jgi:hypothetical protein
LHPSKQNLQTLTGFIYTKNALAMQEDISFRTYALPSPICPPRTSDMGGQRHLTPQASDTETGPNTVRLRPAKALFRRFFNECAGKGKAGEVYRRFSRRTNGAGRYGDSEPWVKIIHPDGKEVASTNLEYG